MPEITRVVAQPLGEPRTRLAAPERREQLLTVAGALFAEHGYHRLSMEQLADAAGVSKPVLYQHFPSKRDLYLALVRDALAQMEGQVRDALDGTTDNRARVDGAIGAYFDFIEDPAFRLIMTAELTDAVVRDEVDGAMRRVAAAIGALIAEDAGLSRDAAQFLAAAVRGLATEGARSWTERPGIGKREAVHLLSRLAWRGLGSFQPGE
jgi:AcrR family transcriptional regulator